ncbi:phosphonate metabolism protein [Rhodobacteraceae bacterium (ex Bugula neritina AB1)]|nr:phosphonate metabolism protein [Rhodobacteraceae bacterium (ex Bugula neritina AB1)]
MTFTRYAIYYAPPADADWSRFAASWLGWDVEAGRTLAHPTGTGLDVAAITAVPGRYGLHATMKPPMRLADGQAQSGLEDACAALAATLGPVALDGLQLARFGRFLALRPAGDQTALKTLAAACVTELDQFRAPAPKAELDRRRTIGLTPQQEANLTRWGYPHVLDQFRFHITLTGRLPKPELPAVEEILNTHLVPLLPAPFEIRDLALVGEADDGKFHLIHRYPLSG